MKTDRVIMKKLRRENLVFQKLYEAWETAEYHRAFALSGEKSVKEQNRWGILKSEIYKVMLRIIDEYRKDNPE